MWDLPGAGWLTMIVCLMTFDDHESVVALGLPVDLPRFGSSECCSALMADGDWEKLATVEEGQHSDPPSERPLLLAASLGQVEVARLLLQAGADGNRVWAGPLRDTPTCCISQQTAGHDLFVVGVSCVRELTDCLGRSALFVACTWR